MARLRYRAWPPGNFQAIQLEAGYTPFAALFAVLLVVETAADHVTNAAGRGDAFGEIDLVVHWPDCGGGVGRQDFYDAGMDLVDADGLFNEMTGLFDETVAALHEGVAVIGADDGAEVDHEIFGDQLDEFFPSPGIEKDAVSAFKKPDRLMLQRPFEVCHCAPLYRAAQAGRISRPQGLSGDGPARSRTAGYLCSRLSHTRSTHV